MTAFGGITPENRSSWQIQLHLFVQDHQTELSALCWGAFLEHKDNPGVLGVDFKPTPHLIYCSKEAISALNEKVNGTIQEIVGIINAYKPEEEVLILGIGTGEESQLKLIQFKPEVAPPEAYEQFQAELNDLLDRLDQRLSESNT